MLDLTFPRGPGVGEQDQQQAFDAVATEYEKQARELEEAHARIAELEALLAQREPESGGEEEISLEPETKTEDKPKGNARGRKGKTKA